MPYFPEHIPITVPELMSNLSVVEVGRKKKLEATMKRKKKASREVPLQRVMFKGLIKQAHFLTSKI